MCQLSKNTQIKVRRTIWENLSDSKEAKQEYENNTR